MVGQKPTAPREVTRKLSVDPKKMSLLEGSSVGKPPKFYVWIYEKLFRIDQRHTQPGLAKLVTKGYHWWKRAVCTLFLRLSTCKFDLQKNQMGSLRLRQKMDLSQNNCEELKWICLRNFTNNWKSFAAKTEKIVPENFVGKKLDESWI